MCRIRVTELSSNFRNLKLRMKNLKRILLSAVCLLLSGTAASVAAQPQGMQIDYPGENHAVVRIDEPKRVLLLPVEERAPEAAIVVLADNRPERRLNVRLALNRTDYFVPLDLSEYAGKNLALDIRMVHSRTNVRDIADDACWEELALSDTFDFDEEEPFRPHFHFTPAYGWMNDPNGMFYKDGEWHLFYQYNPYGSMWGNMHWGHAVSRDLVTWEHLPVALSPDGWGAIFSGSCVVDTENTAGFGEGAVVALYTSADMHQMQSLAYSTDNGRTFTTYAKNPVLITDSECRDPHLFRDERHGRWVMVLAAALDREIRIYTSPDLKAWTLRSSFGHGYGARKGVWECPDLVELPVRGTDRTKWVLIVNLNPGGPYGNCATQYFVGEFDGETFRCDTEPSVTKWMDRGMDHYAAVTWHNAPAGRHTLLGWMSNWQYANEVPTMRYRSAMTLPRELELREEADGSVSLAVSPAPEVDALRSARSTSETFSVGTTARVRQLPAAHDRICEIEIAFTPQPNCGNLFLTLSNDRKQEVTMCCNPATGICKMDRRQSGNVSFSKDFPKVTTATCAAADGSIGLRIFVDRSSIEAFAADGSFVMTDLVFPDTPYTTLSIRTDRGRCDIDRLNIYSLKHRTENE